MPSLQGSSNLVLPLVVMGAVSVVGGLSALRLPETLHTSLPQTAEEGEQFGKDWTYADCLACGDQRYSFGTIWFYKINDVNCKSIIL